MKADLMAQMEPLEQFVGIHLSPEQREEVVKHCSFDSMKVRISIIRRNLSEILKFNTLLHQKWKELGINDEFDVFFRTTK